MALVTHSQQKNRKERGGFAQQVQFFLTSPSGIYEGVSCTIFCGGQLVKLIGCVGRQVGWANKQSTYLDSTYVLLFENKWLTTSNIPFK